MSTIRVAVPVLHGRRKFHFDKGRPWSVIEHLLLFSLTNGQATASELADRGDIPQRVVIEALIRLMHAGWVEMKQTRSSVYFKSTKNGVLAAKQDELPNAARRLSRNLNFVIDQITGTIYRSRELPFSHQHVVEERAKKENIIWLTRPKVEIVDEVRPLVEALFLDDERFVSVEQTGERLSERWSLVTVRRGEIDGLTNRAPANLVKVISDAAKVAKEDPSKHTDQKVEIPNSNNLLSKTLPDEHRITFLGQDLILGGEEHHDVIRSILNRARHRAIIHSTFIAEERFDDLLPAFQDASNRGVTIDILWGQDDSSTKLNSSRRAVDQIRQRLDDLRIDLIRVHPFSTKSHCKILLADEGSLDKFSVVIGSCNWLSSQFNSYEASIRLRDPKIVADAVDQIAELSKGGKGVWTDLTNDLAALGSHLRLLPHKSSGQGTAQIVLSSNHIDIVRRARDECEKRIFVTSHRFGMAGQSIVIAPSLTAAEKKNVEVSIFYGTTSGVMGGKDAADITVDAALKGVKIRAVKKPRLHAKILAWDDDSVMITSQNWLSADPPDSNQRQEIGVLVTAPNVASRLIEKFMTSKIE